MRTGLWVALVAAVGASSAPAAADPNDLVLSRLATRVMTSGVQTSAIGQPLEFRELSSALGVVLAPHLLTPADTLGFSGFQFTVDYATTQVDTNGAYWRALESGQAPASMRTVGFFARKGMWLPLPSFEVGAGAIHLMDSHIWAANLYAKFALHEGYHDLPLPSLAVRGAVSRVMTQQELDMTVASIDVAISKHFGVGGTWRFDPFVGGNILMIVTRSEVIDSTPNVDATQPGNAMDSYNNFVFKDQDNVIRNRVFLGAKFQYYVFQFTAEVIFGLAGSSADAQPGVTTTCAAASTTTACNAKDDVAAQRTLALSAGFDF